jgi:hypothetical protein
VLATTCPDGLGDPAPDRRRTEADDTEREDRRR